MIFKLKKAIQRWQALACVAVLALGLTACKDNEESVNYSPYDPAQPVVITDFTPESGGYQDQIIVKGKNFGNNKDNVTLTIGGKKAVVVNVMWDKLYAFVPSGAFSGIIELTVKDDSGNTSGPVTADKVFDYQRKTVVGTLCGYQNENDSQGELWGSFDVCAGFNAEGCLAFDPINPDILYVIYDRSDGFIAQLDLQKREVRKLMDANKFQTKRLRNVSFSLDGEYMLVSTDRDDNGTKSTSVWIVKRGANGGFANSTPQVLTAYKQCNGVAVHPVNGEIYFNSYENGQLFRTELETYLDWQANPPIDLNNGNPIPWTGYQDDGAFRELFKIQDPSYEFQVTIHPTGNYAYLTVINRNYILRSDYDWDKKEFTTPYIVAGLNSNLDDGGWEDAVGTNARLHRPYQGVFVKNQQYEAEGRDDVYDFYFCDTLNFCIRYITPDGVVRTYAGRAPSTNGNIWGTEDGDLRAQSRFRDVTGIAYSEKYQYFYILDHNNRRIRTIGKESEETNIEITPSEDSEEGETN